MDSDEIYEELLYKKNLALSTQYQSIRRRLLDFMVSNSRYVEPDDTRFKWWLMLLKEVDGWVDECDKYLEKQKKKKEIN